MIRLVIDTDPGVDDAHALMAALAHAEARVEALTTVAGNVPLAQTTTNACAILDAMDAQVPVYAGCDRSILGATRHAVEFHGADGLGGIGAEPDGGQVRDEHAVNALVRLADEAPGELTLLAIGPLTNVALATRLDPELPSKYARLVVMGGAVRGMGNTTVAAEFNFYADPEAAAVVLDAWPELTLVSWEATLEHPFSPEQVRALLELDTPRAEFFRRISRGTLDFIEGTLGQRVMLEPDLLAAAAALEPETVTGSERHVVEVALGDPLTRGQSVVDWYKRSKRPGNVEVVLSMDTGRVWEMVRDALA